MARPQIMEMSQEDLQKMHRLQLMIFTEIDRLCRANHIKYTLCGGSLLGAIRHKGFIPWDDDIDVSMLREDYDRFCKVCEEQLDREKYFLQNTDTDPEYRFIYGRMLLNGTSYIRSGQEHMKFRNGIFVDIFPRDGCSDNVFLFKIQRMLGFVMRKTLYSPIGCIRAQKLHSRMTFKILSIVPRTLALKILTIIQKLNFNKKTDVVYCYGLMGYTEKRKIDMGKTAYKQYKKSLRKETSIQKMERKTREKGLKRVFFEEVSDMEFEGVSAMVTNYYDTWLKYNYEDYMELPPENKRVVHQVASFYDFGIY